MKKFTTTIILVFTVFFMGQVSFGQVAGDIIITEIMQNPAQVTDPKGEYFEIYNTTAAAIDINGWIIKDDGTDSHTINNGGPLLIASNSYLTLGRNGTATNGGYTPDYVWSSYTLGNSADEVILLFGAIEIDRVNYDGGATFPDPNGKSMTLQIDKYDSVSNNNGFNWCEATTPYGAGDLGTPGLVNNTFSTCECSNKELINYETTGLWSNGTGPDLTTDVQFRKSYNTSAGNINACNCKVKSAKTITIADGTYMNIYNEINNLGTIKVENEGSLVQVIDSPTNVIGSGSFQIKKTTTPYVEYDFTYWSSPVENADLHTVFADNITGTDQRIFDFNTANFEDTDNNSYDDTNDDWNVVSGAMTPAKGYIAMGSQYDWPFVAGSYTTGLTQSVSFDGKINNGVITMPVVLAAVLNANFANDNLIGNPYPSAIDGVAFLNHPDNTELEGTLYFWSHQTPLPNTGGTAGTDDEAYNFTNDDYATFTTAGYAASASGATVPNDTLIASGQGFFASVTTAGSITFDNSMRVTTGNDNFFRPANQRNRIWVNFTGDNGLFRQILVGFFDNATNGHDRLLDGKRINSGTQNFDFYSLINTDKYAIQVLPLLTADKTVPLGFNAPQTGTFTLSIDRLEGDLNNVNVYIKDNVTNSYHNLKTANFVFDINQTGTINNRYEMVFSRNTLTTPNTQLLNANVLKVYNHNNAIQFTMSNSTKITTITGFDVLGKTILQKSAINNTTFTMNNTLENGSVIIFKIGLENGQTITKKFIKL